MSTPANADITPAPDGPLVVKGLTQLTNSQGAIETSEKMFLCRCGGSANKPFCDGTHKKIGFSSARLDGRAADEQTSYQGKRITIHDNRSLCAHAGLCTDGLTAVFRYGKEPWIDPNAAEIEAIIATIGKCPSGALQYTLGDAHAALPEQAPAVHVMVDGPYAVSGGPALTNAEWGAGASTQTYTLCRCGASKNKPFCDGSHWSVKFTDDKN